MLLLLLFTVPCTYSQTPCFSLYPTPLAKSKSVQCSLLPPLCPYLQNRPVLKENRTITTGNTWNLWSLIVRGSLIFFGNYTILFLPPFTHTLLKDCLFSLFAHLTQSSFFLLSTGILVQTLLKRRLPQRHTTTSISLPTSVCTCTVCLLACHQAGAILTSLLSPILSWFFKLSPPAILPLLLQLQFFPLLLNHSN